MGGVMISFSAIFVRLTRAEPDVAAFYRTFVGGLFLVLVSMARKESLRVSARILPWVLSAGVCLVLDLLFWHRSIGLVGPGLATILINFQVLSWLLWGGCFFQKLCPNGFLLPFPWPSWGCGFLWALISMFFPRGYG
jgi:drug/metabolite transporter (DMT)-like permease